MTITQLRNTISNLELTELAGTPVAAHAVVQVIDPHQLVVVVFHGHDTPIVEHAIRSQNYATTELTSANDIITVTI